MKGAKYEILSDMVIESEVIETKKGNVEIYFPDKESKDKPVILSSHGGFGGVD